MYLDASGGAADPLRIFSGSGPSSNPLDPTLLFSSNYIPALSTKFSVAYPSGTHSGEIALSPAYPSVPLAFAYSCPVSGPPLYPYFITTSFYNGTYFQYQDSYLLWQVYKDKIKWWTSQGTAGTFFFWLMDP